MCYRGSSEMSQIHTQNSHFSRLWVISPQSERSELGAFYFCPGVLSGYCCVCLRVVTVLCGKEVTVIECVIGGLQKSGKFTCSGDTFKGNGLLLILMIFYIQTDGYLII